MDCIELNWLCKHMRKFRSNQSVIFVLNWEKHSFSLWVSLIWVSWGLRWNSVCIIFLCLQSYNFRVSIKFLRIIHLVRTQTFSKIEYFLPPDTHTYESFFGKFGVRAKWMTPWKNSSSSDHSWAFKAVKENYVYKGSHGSK